MDLDTPNDVKALALSADRAWLLARLRDSQRMTDTPYNELLRGSSFDFQSKRLCGRHGFTLQWKLRRRPDQPIEYDNQQTSVGIVTLDKKEGYSSVYRRIWGSLLPDGCLGSVVVHPVRFIGRSRGACGLCLIRTHTVHDPLGEPDAARQELAGLWEIHHDFGVDVDTQLGHVHGPFIRRSY